MNRRRSREVSPRLAAEIEQQRQDRRAAALAAMADWPEGMPPLACMGWHVGVLVGLERDGLCVRLPRDNLGDLRFALPSTDDLGKDRDHADQA
jgi:hypothetical protein